MTLQLIDAELLLAPVLFTALFCVSCTTVNTRLLLGLLLGFLLGLSLGRLLVSGRDIALGKLNF